MARRMVSAGAPAARAHAAIAVAAVLFGTTFELTQRVVDEFGPMPFLSARFLVGGIVLWPLARRRPADPGVGRASIVAAAPLLTGYALLHAGLLRTTSTAAAFIAYLLVVIVPLLAAVTSRRFPRPPTIGGVAIATAGLVLLAGGAGPGGGAGMRLGTGELLVLGCAVAFAVHIVVLAELTRRHDVLRLNALQLLAVGGAAFLPGLAFGGYRFSAGAWLATIYAGVAASAVALLLQMWGQRHMGPTRASLLLMLDPVTAAVVGHLAGEVLSAGRWAGAILILAGIAVAEIPARRALSRTGSEPQL